MDVILNQLRWNLINLLVQTLISTLTKFASLDFVQLFITKDIIKHFVELFITKGIIKHFVEQINFYVQQYALDNADYLAIFCTRQEMESD